MRKAAFAMALCVAALSILAGAVALAVGIYFYGMKDWAELALDEAGLLFTQFGAITFTFFCLGAIPVLGAYFTLRYRRGRTSG